MKSHRAPLWRVVREGGAGESGSELDVVGLGEISLDQVCVLDRVSSLRASDKLPLQSLERRPGGAVATAVLGCAHLGLRSGLIGATGKDEAGRLSLAPLSAAGVDLSGVREVADAATREAVILVDRPTGDRSVLFHRDRRLSLEAGSLGREEVLRARALLLDTSDPEAAIWAAGIARSAGIPVLLDADSAWPEPETLLSRVDFPVVSQRLAEEFGGTGKVRDGLRALSAQGATLAVATLGERGTLALSGTEWIESAGFAIEPVDTTGAGDAFRAGFIWGVLAGKSAVEVLEVANAAGALNCRALGAQAGLPAAAEVEALVRQRPPKETGKMRKTRATSGRAMVTVLALSLIAGGGAYNYHRNWQAEQVEQGSRPFAGYAEQDLRDLMTAYGGVVDDHEGEYQTLAKRRTTPRSGSALLDENIANFERAQRASDAKRAVAGIVAENQARLREIESELAYREYVGNGAKVHIRRLTAI